MIWAVAALFVFIVILTLRRGRFRYPLIGDVTRTGDPLGYWATTAFLVLITGVTVWAALQPQVKL